MAVAIAAALSCLALGVGDPVATFCPGSLCCSEFKRRQKAIEKAKEKAEKDVRGHAATFASAVLHLPPLQCRTGASACPKYVHSPNTCPHCIHVRAHCLPVNHGF